MASSREWFNKEQLVSKAASLNVETITAAIAERKPLCSHCFNIFTPHDWPAGAMFEARSILMIPDSELDPMICDNCFNRVVGTFNRHVTNIGTSNLFPTNLVLAHFG